MSESLELERDDWRQQARAAQEMLALILSETGPVAISRSKHNSVPAGASIRVDVNQEEESVVISLEAPND